MADESPTGPYAHAQWRELAARLSRAVMLPGSWDKRFARGVASLAEDPEAALSERQFATLCRLVHKYRRQIGGAP